MARLTRSAGTSISRRTVDLGPGVLVICIAGKYTGDAGQRPDGRLRPPTAPSAPVVVGRRERDRTSTPLTRHRLLRPARLPFRHSPAGSLARVPAATGRYRPDAPPTSSSTGRLRDFARVLATCASPARGSARDAPGSPRRRSGTASSSRPSSRPDRSGRATVSSSRRPDAGAVALGLLGVGGEIAFEVAADLGPVVAELADRLLDLVGEHRGGQRLGRAEDRALATAVDALRAAEHDERGATRDGGCLARAASDLRGHVHRGSGRGLEDLELLAQRGACR